MRRSSNENNLQISSNWFKGPIVSSVHSEISLVLTTTTLTGYVFPPSLPLSKTGDWFEAAASNQTSSFHTKDVLNPSSPEAAAQSVFRGSAHTAKMNGVLRGISLPAGER